MDNHALGIARYFCSDKPPEGLGRALIFTIMGRASAGPDEWFSGGNSLGTQRVAALTTTLGIEGAFLRENRTSMTDVDMRTFASRAGTNMTFVSGSNVFSKGEPGTCMYVIQSGTIEIIIADKVVELCGPNEALGFMSVIDGSSRTSTARVKETAELSVIDARKFRFMVDEVPNFAMYIMQVMARRIRGMSAAL